jgi:DNA-binding NarL/FixJ family response regulator
MIDILIAEDHDVVRAGIKALLETQDEFRIVGETADGSMVADLVAETKPDVLVLDLNLHHLSGIESMRRTLRVRPQIKVVVLSMHRGDQYVVEAFRTGAHGYVLKDDSFDELTHAIREALQGRTYLSRDLSVNLRDSGSLEDDPYHTLTNREKEILQLVAEGFTNEEVAQRLFISRRTVETHRRNLMEKLDLSSQTKLVHYAIRRGLLNPE